MITQTQKNKARSAVSTAIQSGRIVRPRDCEECSNKGIIQAHHKDYLKPLDINWLCSKCHKKWHDKFGNQEFVNDTGMAFITMQLEDDLKDRFEAKAKADDRTISALLRILIKQYLGEDEK